MARRDFYGFLRPFRNLLLFGEGFPLSSRFSLQSKGSDHDLGHLFPRDRIIGAKSGLIVPSDDPVSISGRNDVFRPMACRIREGFLFVIA
jgi:hypothetical protein